VTDTLRDRIAEALAVHNAYTIYEPDSDMNKVTCDCGWVGDTDYCSEQERHVADAILAIPGIAVVELPEPSEFADMWLHGDVHVASPCTHPRSPVALEIDPGSPVWISTEYARDLAAALLAAADYAEKESKETQ